MIWLGSLFIFILGTVMGSFLNVIIYRLPLNQSIVKPRSHCPNCKTQIPFYRNIPIITFLIQGGKCASCKHKISVQYPIVEFLTGMIWLVYFSNCNPTEALISALVSSVLIAIAWIDLQTMMIPISLIISGIILVLLSLLLNVTHWKTVSWGLFVGVSLPLFMMGLSYIFTKRQGMGWGDIQLGGLLGSWNGPISFVLTLFLASFLGLVAWVMISIIKGFDRNRPLPFAPYLVISAIVMSFSKTFFGEIVEKFILL